MPRIWTLKANMPRYQKLDTIQGASMLTVGIPLGKIGSASFSKLPYAS